MLATTLKASITLLFNNIKTFMLLFIMPYSIFSILIELLYVQSPSPGYFDIFMPVTLSFLMGVIMTPILTFYIHNLVTGRPSIKMSALQGNKKILAYSVLAILMVLVYSVGLALLIIPGIIFMVRFSLASYYLILNDEGAIDSMQTSWRTTGEHFWPLLAAGAIIYGTTPIIFEVLSLFNVEELIGSVFYSLLNTILAICAIIISQIFFYLFYVQYGEQPSAGEDALLTKDEEMTA